MLPRYYWPSPLCHASDNCGTMRSLSPCVLIIFTTLQTISLLSSLFPSFSSPLCLITMTFTTTTPLSELQPRVLLEVHDTRRWRTAPSPPGGSDRRFIRVVPAVSCCLCHSRKHLIWFRVGVASVGWRGWTTEYYANQQCRLSSDHSRPDAFADDGCVGTCLLSALHQRPVSKPRG